MTPTIPTEPHYDVLVLGAGTAGSVAAGRLAAAGLSVALVEAGPDSRAASTATVPELEAVRDPARMHELWDSRLDWGWRTVPQRHAAGRRLHLPRGRVVGGSHALNAMIWVRGHVGDYDGWAAAGATGWSWADVEPVFQLLEGDGAGGERLTAYRRGPVDIATDYEPSALHTDLVRAAVAAGLPFNPDYNAGDPLGISFTQLTIRDGRRWMTSDAFLTQVVTPDDGPRPGAVTLFAETVADRLVLEGGRCTGAVVARPGASASALRADEVVLSLGALATPLVLQRSGIGHRDDLAAAGVDLVHECPGVGRGLADHWLVPLVYATDRDPGVAAGLPPTQTHVFWSRSGEGRPDLQPINFSAPLVPEGWSPPGQGFSLMAGIVQPVSRGRVSIIDADPASAPLIDPDVLAAPEDVDALTSALRLCRSIGESPVLRDDWGAREVAPGPGAADLAAYVRESVVTYHHSAGTCAIGAVVDPSLQVLGVPGLRVADASVMPTIVTGNTNAPVAMIGWRAADFVLSGRRG